MRAPYDRQPIPAGTLVRIHGDPNLYQVGARLWTGEYRLMPTTQQRIVKPEQVAHAYFAEMELGRPIG